ncbi:hypothetical protein V501_00093 [Pseudogymnoascus sp. VKM F-4519 (FW-2642)]|nr:hypothetical protein V501_00093 [Pseudogymnoascus sp. VKM F-4519 (FW-2642)]
MAELEDWEIVRGYKNGDNVFFRWLLQSEDPVKFRLQQLQDILDAKLSKGDIPPMHVVCALQDSFELRTRAYHLFQRRLGQDAPLSTVSSVADHGAYINRVRKWLLMIRMTTNMLSETPNQPQEHLIDNPVTPSSPNKFAGLEIQYSSQGDDLEDEFVYTGPEFESKMYTPAYAVELEAAAYLWTIENHISHARQAHENFSLGKINIIEFTLTCDRAYANLQSVIRVLSHFEEEDLICKVLTLIKSLGRPWTVLTEDTTSVNLNDSTPMAVRAHITIVKRRLKGRKSKNILLPAISSDSDMKCKEPLQSLLFSIGRCILNMPCNMTEAMHLGLAHAFFISWIQYSHMRRLGDHCQHHDHLSSRNWVRWVRERQGETPAAREEIPDASTDSLSILCEYIKGHIKGNYMQLKPWLAGRIIVRLAAEREKNFYDHLAGSVLENCTSKLAFSGLLNRSDIGLEGLQHLWHSLEARSTWRVIYQSAAPSFQQLKTATLLNDATCYQDVDPSLDWWAEAVASHYTELHTPETALRFQSNLTELARSYRLAILRFVRAPTHPQPVLESDSRDRIGADDVLISHNLKLPGTRSQVRQKAEQWSSDRMTVYNTLFKVDVKGAEAVYSLGGDWSVQMRPGHTGPKPFAWISYPAFSNTGAYQRRLNRLQHIPKVFPEITDSVRVMKDVVANASPPTMTEFQPGCYLVMPHHSQQQQCDEKPVSVVEATRGWAWNCNYYKEAASSRPLFHNADVALMAWSCPPTVISKFRQTCIEKMPSFREIFPRLDIINHAMVLSSYVFHRLQMPYQLGMIPLPDSIREVTDYSQPREQAIWLLGPWNDDEKATIYGQLSCGSQAIAEMMRYFDILAGNIALWATYLVGTMQLEEVNSLLKEFKRRGGPVQEIWYGATASLRYQTNLLINPGKHVPRMLDNHQQGGHVVPLLYNVEILCGNPTVSTAEFILPSLQKLLQQHLDNYLANKEQWNAEFLAPFVDKALADLLR